MAAGPRSSCAVSEVRATEKKKEKRWIIKNKPIMEVLVSLNLEVHYHFLQSFLYRILGENGLVLSNDTV